MGFDEEPLEICECIFPAIRINHNDSFALVAQPTSRLECPYLREARADPLLANKNLHSQSTSMDALLSNLQGRFCSHRQSGQDDLVGPEITLALDEEKSSQSRASTVDPTLEGAKDTATNLCGLFV
jgi:hypothetical protein